MATKKGTRAGAAERRPKGEDKVDFKPSGVILFGIGGVDYQLRRPLIGEQRRFLEAIDEIAQAERAEKAAAAEEERPVNMSAAVDGMLCGWWRLVVADLAGKDLPADDDDLPVWITSRELLQETRKHWLTVPWGPGGSPSHQEAQKGLDLLKQVTGSLPAT